MVQRVHDDYVSIVHARQRKYGIAEALAAALSKIDISDEEPVQRGLTFHAHRHFFNSLMRGKIADFKLQRLTGHRTEAMVEHYTHLDRSDMDDVLKLQSDTFG